MLKRCSKCGETKPLDGFYRNRNCSDGRGYDCKACRLQYCENNREREAANSRQYRAANWDKIRERRRTHSAERRAEGRKRTASRSPSYMIEMAKMAIKNSTGIPYKDIPLVMAEAKAAQLAVVRALRDRK